MINTGQADCPFILTSHMTRFLYFWLLHGNVIPLRQASSDTSLLTEGQKCDDCIVPYQQQLFDMKFIADI